MTDIPDQQWLDALTEARKAIHEGGRGMIGRNRNYLEYRVARALLSERRKQIERDAKIAEASKRFGSGSIAAAIRAQEPK